MALGFATTGQGIDESPYDGDALLAEARRRQTATGGGTKALVSATGNAPAPTAPPLPGQTPTPALAAPTTAPALVPQQEAAQGLTPSGGTPYIPPPAPAAPAAPGAPPPAPGSMTPAQVAQSASTISATPGAAPTGPTANQGTQDVVRNSYLQMATQNRIPDKNDPAIKAASDAHRANLDRATRSAISDAAEANGPYATGATRGMERMLRERSGALSADFEAKLVLDEIQARRDEIQQALSELSGRLTEDQRQALQKELANLELQLGYAGINADSRIADNKLAVDVADREAYWNDIALQRMLGNF